MIYLLVMIMKMREENKEEVKLDNIQAQMDSNIPVK